MQRITIKSTHDNSCFCCSHMATADSPLLVFDDSDDGIGFCRSCLGMLNAMMRDDTDSTRPTIDSVLNDLEVWIDAEWEAEEKRINTIDGCLPLINNDDAQRLMRQETTFRKGQQKGMYAVFKRIGVMRRTPSTFHGDRS